MKTIVVYSGGLDSTVLLNAHLVDGDIVEAISINYGQRHNRELMAAQNICHMLGIPWNVVDLSALRYLLPGSSQTDASVPVPHGHYAAENMKLTVVPNRNAILLSLAFARAIALKYDAVAYAAHAGDHAIYPDCREDFVQPFSEAMLHADWHRVELQRPFIHKTKAEIVKLGVGMGAMCRQTMARSYSCYEGKELHCGLCGTCQERRAAFRDAGVEDPTEYDPAGIAALPTSQLVS